MLVIVWRVINNIEKNGDITINFRNLMDLKKYSFWVVYEFITFRSTYVHVCFNALLLGSIR
jgi:hypothetical protein